MIKMTDAEKAYFESGGAVHPETGKPAEESPAVETETPEVEAEAAAPEEKKPAAETADDDGEEETVEVADGTNPDGTPRRKMIAFGAYEKQRKQARALKEQLAQQQQQLAYLQGMLERAAPQPQGQTQAPVAPEPLSMTPPDKTREPEKYLAWLESAAAKVLEMEQRSKQTTQQSTQFQQLNEAVLTAETQFINGDPESGVEAHPDFYDALKFVQDRRQAELREAGYDANEIQQIMAAQAQDVAIRALRGGKNPAERVYALAKLQGYKRAQAAPAAVQKPSEAEVVARQARNQASAKTIGTLAGGAESGMSLETLSKLTQSEFNKAWKSGKAQEVMGIEREL